MNRNVNLIPLSHDHHQGLVFALRLKKGAQKRTGPAVLKRFVLDYWENDMHHHFYKEERWLRPMMDDDHSMTITFEMDHQFIRECVRRISELKGDDLYLTIKSLSSRIEKHIRFEERKLFPFLESKLSSNELQEIGKGLADHQESCLNFQPEFWK